MKQNAKKNAGPIQGVPTSAAQPHPTYPMVKMMVAGTLYQRRNSGSQVSLLRFAMALMKLSWVTPIAIATKMPSQVMYILLTALAIQPYSGPYIERATV